MRTLTMYRTSIRGSIVSGIAGKKVKEKGKMVWLQRLALRVLEKFGEEASVEVDLFTPHVIEYDTDSVIKAASIQIQDMLQDNRVPGIIYVGRDYWDQAKSEVQLRPTQVDSVLIPTGDEARSLVGLPVVLVSTLKGVFVAPKESV